MQRRLIHRSTAVVALGTLGAVLLLNVPGEFVNPLEGFGSSGPSGPEYFADYEHGWPWLYLTRSVGHALPAATVQVRPLPVAPIYGVPSLAWASWAFWQGETWELRPGALFGNFIVGVSLILAVAAAWEWRRRRRARAFQFTLAELVIALTIFAMPFGWWRYAKSEYDRETDIAESIVRMRACDYVYAGPLWLNRILGQELLSSAFLRIDHVTLAVADNEEFCETMQTLSSLPCLGELELRSLKFNRASLVPFSKTADIKRLRSLVLSGFTLSEDDISELAKLRQLDELTLTNWSDQKPEVLQRLIGALPNCRVVDPALTSAEDEESGPTY